MFPALVLSSHFSPEQLWFVLLENGIRTKIWLDAHYYLGVVTSRLSQVIGQRCVCVYYINIDYKLIETYL